MTLGGDVEIGNILGGVNLLAFIVVLVKGGSFVGRYVETQKVHGETLERIEKTLGNGEPGAVVKRNVCEALHGGVERQLFIIHEDIRSLHAVVVKINRED